MDNEKFYSLSDYVTFIRVGRRYICDHFMKNKIITIYELMGLIKDDKAPKKIEVDNEIYNFHKGMETSYILGDNEDIKLNFSYYIENDLLNKKDIEILSEENDEWEDIKELEQIISSKAIYDNYEDITKDIHNIVETIDNLVISFNQFIKNQKYLKEKLESKDE